MRGKKIWNSALLLSLMLSMLAFAPAPAQALVVASLTAPTIPPNPPKHVPGSNITIDIYVDDVTDLWSFDFYLSYNTTVLTAVNYTINPYDPAALIVGCGFRNLTWPTNKIDDAAGYVRVGADRGPSGRIIGEFVGTGDGVIAVFYLDNPRILSAETTTIKLDGIPQPRDNYSLDLPSGKITFKPGKIPASGKKITADYTHPGLTWDMPWSIVQITFTIDDRGESPLDLHDSVFVDIWMAPISHQVFDGSFDNRFQGFLTAPHYKSEALMPGDEFDIEITADHVLITTQAVSFVLEYDPIV